MLQLSIGSMGSLLIDLRADIGNGFSLTGCPQWTSMFGKVFTSCRAMKRPRFQVFRMQNWNWWLVPPVRYNHAFNAGEEIWSNLRILNWSMMVHASARVVVIYCIDF